MSIENLEKTPELVFEYSSETELEQVQHALSEKKRKFFLANGYSVDLPNGVKLNDDRHWGRDELLRSIEAEIDNEKINLIQKEIEEAWPEIVHSLKRLFEDLKIEMPIKYFIRFTNYGPGGQFNPPNGIILSVSKNKNWPNRITRTITHEAIHDAIHHLIVRYGFADGSSEGHWIKERIVDLLMKKIIPDSFIQEGKLSTETSQLVNEIFNQYYPNLEKILEEISNINNLEDLSKGNYD